MSKCSVEEAVSKIKSVLETKGLSDAGKKMAESRVTAIAAVLVEMQKFKNEHVLGRENQGQAIEQAKENAKKEEAKNSTPTGVKKGKTGTSEVPVAGDTDVLSELNRIFDKKQSKLTDAKKNNLMGLIGSITSVRLGDASGFSSTMTEAHKSMKSGVGDKSVPSIYIKVANSPVEFHFNRESNAGTTLYPNTMTKEEFALASKISNNVVSLLKLVKEEMEKEITKKPKKVQGNKFNPEKTLEERVEKIAKAWSASKEALLEEIPEGKIESITDEEIEDIAATLNIDNTPPWEDSGTVTTTESKKQAKPSESKNKEYHQELEDLARGLNWGSEGLKVVNRITTAKDLAVNKLYGNYTTGLIKYGSKESWTSLIKQVNEGKTQFAKQVLKAYGNNKEAALNMLEQARANYKGTAAHELLHALTVDWLDANRGSALNKELEELYAYAKREAKKLPADHVLNVDRYWQDSKPEVGSREFIAEVLSKPELLKAFNEIKYRGKAESVGGKFIKILGSVLKALGLTADPESVSAHLGAIVDKVVVEREKGMPTQAKTNESYNEVVEYTVNDEYYDTAVLGEYEGLRDSIRSQLINTYQGIQATDLDKVLSKYDNSVLKDSILAAGKYDKTMNTVPYKFALVYVDVLAQTPFMKKLINNVVKGKNVSEEKAKVILAEHIGKRYVGLAKGEVQITKISKSMVKAIWDRVAKIFGAKSLQSIANDMDILGDRFYLGENKRAIRLTPQEGFAEVDTEATFKDQPFAADVLKTVMKVSDGKAQFTGSAALALQGSVYRKGKNGITDLHDLDFGVLDKDAMENIESELWDEYSWHKIYDFGLKGQKTRHVSTLVVVPKNMKVPNNKIKRNSNNRVIEYVIEEGGKEVGRYEATLDEKGAIIGEKTTGVKAVIVDLLEDPSKTGGVEYTSETLKTKLTLSPAEDIFMAKDAMSKDGISRDKDIMDKNLYKAKSNESYDKMAGYMDISPTEMTLNKEC
jgi:hypothetical protein